MTTLTNGRARKSLAEQINRLDTILDGLADALNEAVAAAVREAVGVAVREAVAAALREALANPALLARLAAAAAQPAAPSAGGSPLRALLVRARAAAASVVGAGRCAAAWCWQSLRQLLQATVYRAGKALAVGLCLGRLGWRLRLPLLVSLAAGATAGVAAFYVGPWLAAATSGAGGFALATAAQLCLALRRLLYPYPADGA